MLSSQSSDSKEEEDDELSNEVDLLDAVCLLDEVCTGVPRVRSVDVLVPLIVVLDCGA